MTDGAGRPRAVLAAAAALALALTHPGAVWNAPVWQAVVYIDITQSMNARDMRWAGEPVSRLAFAREALRQALSQIGCGARLGLGLFTEYRVLLLLQPVEVCANRADLDAVIARLDGNMSWAGASEITKGVGWALRTTAELAPGTAMMFVTDGHEAPPLRPGAETRLRPAGVLGYLLGVGGDRLVPIPKFGPDGQPLGVWQADEVMQTDPISAGRTVGGAQQSLVEADGRPVQAFPGSGQEHRSSLKQAHLQALAAGAGLGYRRLREPADLLAALNDPALARPAPVRHDLRPGLVAFALLCLAVAFRPRDVTVARRAPPTMDAMEAP